MVIKQALPHNNEVVAIASTPYEIKLRKKGKSHYGTEKSLCCIRDNTLVIDRQIAERFGIGIEFL